MAAVRRVVPPVSITEDRARLHDTQTELAPLPEPDKVATIDAVATVVALMRVTIDSARPEPLRELVGMLVERIKVTEDGANEIEPVAAARPSFAAAENLLLAPPDGLGGSESKAVDPLASFAGA